MHNGVESEQSQPRGMVQYRSHGWFLVHGDPARSLLVPHYREVLQDSVA